ncbi:regulatory signaling modulator protein AmpE [Pseudomonas aeruginosa]|nr:regulatory signaling modulator protein AmpE [Pseudomonas aeruginosa]
MTLFTTLLVLIAERLFKLGEHWQLDHRLEVVFRLDAPQYHALSVGDRGMLSYKGTAFVAFTPDP